MERFEAGKCTVSATKLVRIDVDGTPHPEGFPHVPDDGGLVGRLIRAQSTRSVPYPKFTAVSGAGVYAAFYDPQDAQAVLDWLADQTE